MRTATSNWDNENGAQKKPRFLFDMGLTNDYASGEFSGRNTSTEPMYAGVPKIRNTEIDPLNPTLDLLGEASINVQDNGNEITNALSSNTLLGATAVIKYGFEDITSSDFMNLYKGRVIDYSMGSDLVNYNFRVLSAFFDLNSQVFTGVTQTTIDGQFGDWTNTITLASNANSGQADIVLSSWPETIKEGDEVYIYDDTPDDETIVVDSLDPSTLTITATANLTNTYTTAQNASIDNTKIPVTSATGFLASSVPSNPPWQDGNHVIVGPEIIETDNTSTIDGQATIHVATRKPTYVDSVTGRHYDDTIVKECWVLRDDPITLLLNMLTTTSGGANGSYDLGYSQWGGPGMDEDLVDFAGFELIKDTYFSSGELRYFITEPWRAIDFAIDVARTAGFYFVITQHGLLSARKVIHRAPGMAVDTIADGDFAVDDSGQMVGFRWSSGRDKIINEIEWKYDYDPGTNKYFTTRLWRQSSGASTYNTKKRHVIESKGLRRGLSPDTNFIDPLNSVILQRYLNPPPRVDFDLKMENIKLEAGDWVYVTSSFLPDIENGDRTLATELMELVKAEPDFDQGVVHCSGYFYDQENGVSVGNSTTVLAADMTQGTATFDATDANAIDGTNDAYFDNSADAGGVSGTRYIVVVKIVLGQDTGSGTANSIMYHIRIGTESGGSITPLGDGELDFTHSWVSGKYGNVGHTWYQTHVFDEINSGSGGTFDVSIDFDSQSGADAGSINTITMASVTIETDGVSYSEVT